MRKYTHIPAISGPQLIRLLHCDGWIWHRKARHGWSLHKNVGGHELVTVVPISSASLPSGTLMKILGSKQTQLGKGGLLRLLNKYGLPSGSLRSLKKKT